MLGQGRLLTAAQTGWRLLGTEERSPLTCSAGIADLWRDGPETAVRLAPDTEPLACLPPRLDHAAPRSGSRWPQAFCPLSPPVHILPVGDLTCH